MGFGSYVAGAAEVSVSEDGTLKIHRIVAATDPGPRGQPTADRRAGRGSFVYGLSAALYGACTVKDGRIESRPTSTATLSCGWTRSVRRDHSDAVRRLLGRRRRADLAVAAPAVLNASSRDGLAGSASAAEDTDLRRHEGGAAGRPGARRARLGEGTRRPRCGRRPVPLPAPAATRKAP